MQKTPEHKPKRNPFNTQSKYKQLPALKSARACLEICKPLPRNMKAAALGSANACLKICLRRLWNPASQRAEHVSHWPHAETVHGARSLRPARNSSPGLLPPGSADDATTPPKPAQKTSAWTPLCMGRYPAWTKPLRCSTTTHVQGACTCTYAPSLSPPNPNKSPHPWGAG